MKKTFCVLAACLVLSVGSSAAILTVTSPNGNENWAKASKRLITWTAVGVSGNVKLVLYKAGEKFGDIASGVPASQQSYLWDVGVCDVGTAPVGHDYKVKVRTLDNTMADQSNGMFSIGPSGPAPGPSPGSAFALTAPNGGESWPRGSTRLITWNPGVATGSVRLDLYKGGTAPANIIGCIKTMTAAATGKYSWPVGDREGNTRAPEGNDYYVVIHAYTPDIRDPGNGPFTIAPPEHVAAKTAKAATSFSSFKITNPRRGDRWYKGTGYTITWTTGGLEGSPVRLDLVKIDGTTLVQSIAENIPNNGQYFWAISMSLPDAETLYKIRLQTMDGTHADTTGPFPIAKAKPTSGPPAIKVTAPGGPSQLGTGLTYAIRWTSTCGTSVNGPTDDFFTIELMNSTGSARVRWLLENARAVYDSGNPDGSHSWHWDWKIPVNETAGTYRIRVTSLTGQCVGLGETFQVVYRQEIKEYVLESKFIQNCYHVFSMTTQFPNLIPFRDPAGMKRRARVGFCWHTQGPNHVTQHVVYRSRVVFAGEDWYKDKGHIVKATLIIRRQWTFLSGTWGPANYAPVLGGVVLLNKAVSCPQGEMGQCLPPAAMGTPVAIDAGQGAGWDVDITQPYRVLIQNGTPDRGVILYPTLDSNPCGPEDDCYYHNAEWYDVTLTLRFAKDILE
jgi:hypothetical protein